MNKKGFIDLDEINWSYALFGVVAGMLCYGIMTYAKADFMFKLMGALLAPIALYVYLTMTE